MVEIALAVGVYSYLIFGLGLLSQLGTVQIKAVTFLLFFSICCLIYAKNTLLKKEIKDLWLVLKKDRFSFVLFLILVLGVIVNLIGALGPELAFDSLWYHLTLPKIYLREQKIFFLKGGLFYYSSMPKLTEMLYLASLVFSPDGILAKFIHFLFGIFSVIALFNFSKRYLKTKQSLLVTVLFYTSLIVGWESITAYVDLSRTFFEILALDLFLQWGENRERKVLLYESAIMMGLAVSAKLIAFASLLIFLILILITGKKLLSSLRYLLLAVFTVSPWLVFSYISTGNPIYPVFGGLLDANHRFAGFNLIAFIKDIWKLFYHPADMTSPIFLIFFPFILGYCLNKKTKSTKILLVYFFLSLLFWYLTPRTGGTRFFLPYLSVLSFLVVISLENAGKFFQKFLLITIFFCSLINIGYRFLANYKFLKVVLGLESKEKFLVEKLDFSNNDFYDPGQEIKKIVRDDLVLVFGSHNLFYADFRFFHESFAPKSIKYSYILTQNFLLSKKYGHLKELYFQPQTNVKLYLYGGSMK